MFTTTILLDAKTYPNGELGHIDFHNIQWAMRQAQQAYLRERGLDLQALKARDSALILPRIENVDYGILLFADDEISTGIEAHIDGIRIRFKIVLWKKEKKAASAIFCMAFLCKERVSKIPGWFSILLQP